MIDFSPCPIAPWPTQKVGAEFLVDHPGCLLIDDVGLGKSLTSIAAVCDRFRAGEIDAVIVVCPAQVWHVWASRDPLLGEVVKHMWASVPYTLHEYSAKRKTLPTPSPGVLQIVVTNYEVIRMVERDTRPAHQRKKRRTVVYTNLPKLVDWAARRKTWLLIDEGWALFSPQSKQSKACYLLRQACERVTILNGTPGRPDQMFTAFQILDTSILECKNWFHFRNRYCEVAGPFHKIVGYTEMDDYHRRTAPYILRRDNSVLGLPDRLPPSIIEAPLTPSLWDAYRTMRDDLVVELEEDVSIAAQAGVKTLRLRQLLAGFLGGFTEGEPVREMGREKLEAITTYLTAQDLQEKAVVWTKFRHEAQRLARTFRVTRPTYLLVGEQDPVERETALKAFAPGARNTDCAVLIGHPAAGGAGVNLSAASFEIYASQIGARERGQCQGRVFRPGQTKRVRTVDVMAVGPQGQKTLDHALIAAVRAEQDTIDWTVEQWKTALTAE